MASDMTEKLEQLSQSSTEQQTRISIDEVEGSSIHNIDIGQKEEMIEEEREVIAVQEEMIEEEEGEVMSVQEEEEGVMDVIKENTVDADSLLNDLSSSDIDQLLSVCDDDMHVGVASGSGDTRKSVVRLRVLQCEQQQSG